MLNVLGIKKKIKKSEKNSEVGGWVKPQFGFFFFGLVVVVFFAVYVSKKNNEKMGRGGVWVRSGQSEFFLDFFIFLTLQDPLVSSFRFVWICMLWIYGHWKG